MLLAKTLSWYKRKEVQKKLLEHAADKEIGMWFGIGRLGKRPNILSHEADILDLAKKRATSFHASEELWINPMMLNTGMSKKELSELRRGWDLILDIDCKYWPLAKLATHLFVQAIKEHGVSSVTVKFSGNKGFHIAVPFESFPEKIHNLETKDWFPEGPKRIAQYLLDYITEKKFRATNNEVILSNYKIPWKKIEQELGITKSSVTKTVCVACKKQKKRIIKNEFACTSCGYTKNSEEKAEFLNCPRCKSIMKKTVHEVICDCGCKTFENIVDAAKLIDLDTLLISSRHMYRMPYSMHEKSELISCPVKPENILKFNREDAVAEKIDFSIPFMDREVKFGEAAKLVTEAFDHNPSLEIEERIQKEFEVPKEAIPEENFPPCIKAILSGLSDGKKRSQFVLQNFLKAVGWPHEMIEERVKKWNEQNPEPLRETILLGSLRYAKQRKEVIPPPNCRNYYEELGICNPDNLCNRIKNPLQYAKAKNNAKKK